MTTSSPPRPHLVPTSGDDLKSDLVPPVPPLRGTRSQGVRTTTTQNPPTSSPKKDDLNTTPSDAS